MNETYFFDKAVKFVNEIGIETEFGSLDKDVCFLAGLFIEMGRVIIDLDKLKCPGDILHEAAHIAVVPAVEREALNGAIIEKRKEAPAEEMMAIAWSYAACIHLAIDPAFVFHEHGYGGGGALIVENFNEGRYIGVPLLQWLGMTGTSTSRDAAYPAMLKWLRD